MARDGVITRPRRIRSEKPPFPSLQIGVESPVDHRVRAGHGAPALTLRAAEWARVAARTAVVRIGRAVHAPALANEVRLLALAAVCRTLVTVGAIPDRTAAGFRNPAAVAILE